MLLPLSTIHFISSHTLRHSLCSFHLLINQSAAPLTHKESAYKYVCVGVCFCSFLSPAQSSSLLPGAKGWRQHSGHWRVRSFYSSHPFLLRILLPPCVLELTLSIIEDRYLFLEWLSSTNGYMCTHRHTPQPVPCKQASSYVKVTAKYHLHCQWSQVKRVFLGFTFLLKAFVLDTKTHYITAPEGIQYSRQHLDVNSHLEEGISGHLLFVCFGVF